jgi:hypothetical protein
MPKVNPMPNMVSRQGSFMNSQQRPVPIINSALKSLSPVNQINQQPGLSFLN